MYIALKPCRVSGEKYLINDEVDVSKLSAREIAALVKMKKIAGSSNAHAEGNGVPGEDRKSVV